MLYDGYDHSQVMGRKFDIYFFQIKNTLIATDDY